MKPAKYFVPWRNLVVVLVLSLTAAFLVAYKSLHPVQVHAQGTLGGPLPGLTNGQLSMFTVGEAQFNQTAWDPVKGLGPVFTQQKCSICHNNPVPGGTSPVSPAMRTMFFGKLNGDGSFNPLTSEGGFIQQPQSVEQFIGNGTCSLVGERVPSDASVTSQRLPPDLFGSGLVDNIPDILITQFATNKGMGIQGSTNMVVDWNNQTRVGRFGTKAQFASLPQVVGMAFLHDIGVTNPVDLNEDCPGASPSVTCSNVPPGCIRDREPNDSGTETLQIFDFLVYLAPNTPGSGNSTGQALFTSVGCALCHNPSYTTKANVKIPTDFLGHTTQVVTALSNQPVNLYSDLLLHHMGPGLADCMQFGHANGDQWRTTPLWGLSTRPLYLHDGHASDLVSAIEDHMSGQGAGTACSNIYPASEANSVITNFNALSPSDQNSLLQFLMSL
jgi:CxxC motif-containing protein (DUF1111 family)